ncbi:Glycerol-3-phosphate ABC transporter, ATP-binding protein UgpC (TC 3.A.1.1.3) [hydrothermal vent metagenome]|uniref:Glycerol-3-phosphate ABC transporter, ATP-binding protein UgpC (TC 3.A.1.1.3) n=1 Tax=hydrothermal vent metagenome TaxID=652676 RepID=A0A3B0TXS9_9ZZZZ
MTGIRIHNLVKQWGDIRAVDKVSFEVPQGALTVLLGPSGCGKSTILRMIAGLEDVSAGQVHIGGRDVTHMDAAKRGVSMVFQSYALFPHLNVAENILFGLKVRKVPKAEQQRRLAEAARMVGLEDLLYRKPANLSGGQRQRVALTRTIVSNQPVCLMDEPLSNLDAKLRAEMRDEIHSLQRKLGLTMVYVTHDQTEAMSMADQVVLMKEGRIDQIGPPAELYDTPATVFTARFLGVPPMNVMDIGPIGMSGMMGDALGSGPPGWRLGVRPENISIVKQGLPVEVGAIDYMGAETVLRVRHGPQNLMVRINGRTTAVPGEALCVTWKAEDTHLFDEHGMRRGGLDALP